MASSPDTRAFTLIEVIVSMALLFLVAGAAILFFFPSLRDTTRTQVRMELQQQAVTASYRLTADLELCTPSGVGLSQVLNGADAQVTPAGSRVALQPVVDITSDVPPIPIFANHIRLYWWDSQSKALLQWTGVPGQFSLSTTAPHRCNSQEMEDLITGAGYSQRVTICKDVLSFSVDSPATPPAVGLPLRLHLVVERPAVSGLTPERYEIQRTVSLRMAE